MRLGWRGSDGWGGAGGRIGSAVVKFDLEVSEGLGMGAPVGAWAGWEVGGALLDAEGEVNGQGAMVGLLVEAVV